MFQDEYIKITNENEKLNDNSKEILINQIKKYYEVKNITIEKKYRVGEEVILKKRNTTTWYI